ncbi:MAG: type VI secretion system baseplate subunit TssE [Deltaproteobacteria bacterium]|nr:MAG: type VI secretion system baseplate subunit TssE [Deltaproteobacteria bacterium]
MPQITASLIDRLTDKEPESEMEPVPLRTIDTEDFKKSVCRDLEWLLNTRASDPASLSDKRELTVTDYGVPDFGDYFITGKDDQQRLEKNLERAISAFEPRLQGIKVGIGPVDRDREDIPYEKSLRVIVEVVINGLIIAETDREPVAFSTVLEPKSGIGKLRESRPE